MYRTIIYCMALILVLTSCHAYEQGGNTQPEQNIPLVDIKSSQGTTPSTAPVKILPPENAEVPENNTVFLSVPDELCGVVLDDGTKESILACYCASYRKDAEDLVCFGQFDDAYAIYVWGNFLVAEAIGRETVAGYTFEYPSLHYMLIYHDGQFHRLEDAVNCGVISNEDIKVIFDCITENDRCS